MALVSTTCLTSLRAAVLRLIDHVTPDTPRLLVNRERVGEANAALRRLGLEPVKMRTGAKTAARYCV